MSRLNAKTAKMFRKIAGYRNQTATPTSPPFPGIHHLAEFPLFQKRPRNSKPGDVMKGHLIGNRRFIPVPAMETYKYTDEAGMVHSELRQTTQPLPITKPAVHDSKTPKGIYRRTKSLYKNGLLVSAVESYGEQNEII